MIQPLMLNKPISTLQACNSLIFRYQTFQSNKTIQQICTQLLATVKLGLSFHFLRPWKEYHISDLHSKNWNAGWQKWLFKARGRSRVWTLSRLMWLQERQSHKLHCRMRPTKKGHFYHNFFMLLRKKIKEKIPFFLTNGTISHPVKRDNLISP